MPLLSPQEIHLRDPFVLPVAAEQTYYLYGTTDPHACTEAPGTGFDAYRSRDLHSWEGPFPVFRPAADFWATHHYWAPEVHHWRGRYYLFASFKAADVRRGTQVLVAAHPLGPFVPHAPAPLTPAEWECLDGTLFVDADGRPSMIFAHEWLQIHDGSFAAVGLNDDLTASRGDAFELFRISTVPWAVVPPWARDRQPPVYVSDGPFPFRAGNGELCLLFSSWSATGYTTGVARSTSGTLRGPWHADAEPLFRDNGGHAMLFDGFDGARYLTLHAPNDPPPEHPRFFRVTEHAGRLQLA
ncbi:glycoside hydrolase family 43 protein [Horticoccus luteus]|uniref:Glycoside hydrolase family 43 protein n=1 Tax=Horticoccus luteus TaxID=2862869 RepID=A0A8F9XGQ7_9BACT|nr:glycoside hydrolase family 43 protein [Horticoccus luteus]QYM79492.1 glycoside hydrolase family 43 protein [Horticoccus luteus]